jgi:cell division septal protein FtsQ
MFTTAVIYVGEDQFLQRLQQYVELAPTLRERVPDIDYVDLRFDERIYVRPTGKPGKARDGAQVSSGIKGKRR